LYLITKQEHAHENVCTYLSIIVHNTQVGENPGTGSRKNFTVCKIQPLDHLCFSQVSGSTELFIGNCKNTTYDAIKYKLQKPTPKNPMNMFMCKLSIAEFRNKGSTQVKLDLN